MLNDLRYAARTLFRSPGFAAVALLTLAIGTGATTAIFSVVDAVIVRPLPYRDADRLMVVWTNNLREGKARFPISPANYLDLRARAHAFEGTAGFLAFTPTMVMAGGFEPAQVTTAMVSAELFPLLGVQPSLGRGFGTEEEQPGRENVIVVSHRLWRQDMNGAADAVGRVISLNGLPHTVIGVMPAGFEFLSPEIDVWRPLSLNTAIHPSLSPTNRSGGGFGMIGRLRKGVGPGQALADLRAVAQELERQYPENSRLGITLEPLKEEVVREVRPALLVLLGAVALVLLIMAANVATLMLARATARRKEVAIRVALGAGRYRIVRQFLLESVLLALAGGALGVLLAFWALDPLLALYPGELPRHAEVAVSTRVLLFALAASVCTGLLFGAGPALQLTRGNLHHPIREAGTTSHASTRPRLRQALVAAQVALAIVLLAGAGLLLRSFARLLNIDAGFNPAKVLVTEISLPPSRAATPQQAAGFYGELFARLRALPCVEGAGTVTRLPLTARGVTSKLMITGRPVAEGQEPEIEFRRASADYFRTMGIPLLRGRGFGDEDTPSSPRVAIVNRSAAQRFWPGEDPVGARVRAATGGAELTVIGEVGDVRHFGLDQEAQPELYISADQAPPSAPLLVVRTSGDPLAIAPQLRSELRALNPTQPLDRMLSMEDVLADSLAGRRFNAVLLAAFAAAALLVSSLGIYGLLAYTVRQRTPELGVRIALGARPRHVLALLFRESGPVLAGGVVLGLGGALAVARWMRGLLFGISATDPLTLAAVCLAMTTAALLAMILPALRATRVDPMVALRCE